MSAAEDLRRELGEKPKPGPRRSATPRGESVFTLANQIDTCSILDRLGVEHDEKFADCPGCGEPKALLCDHGGVKCLHNRCAEAGPAGMPGFRTNVDIVVHRERLEPADAARRICDWFGVEVPKKKSTPEPEPAESWQPSDDAAPDAPPESETGTSQVRPATIAEVLSTWEAEGPLVHEPTGIVALDELTGGGPVYGTRWYLAGAPDAGKTALLIQMAHIFAGRGIAVGLLAVDEDAGDLVTRLAQRCGYSRAACEIRDPSVLRDVGGALGGLPLRFYDDAWTIESAAGDLAKFAAERGTRAMLGIDSVQTVTCNAEASAGVTGREMSEVSAVTARVRAIRAVASRHRLIAVATSEQGRGAYASKDASQRTQSLASAKWSGSVEYSARVMVALSNVAGESDLLDLHVAKNKHGPRDQHVFLRIDRRSQSLTEADYTPPPEDTSCQDDRRRERVQVDAETVFGLITDQPGLTKRGLLSAAAVAGVSRDRVDAAVAALGSRVELRPGKRDSVHHYPRGGG